MTLVPNIGSFAKRLYKLVSPLALDDSKNDYALMTYVGAWGEMVQEIEDLARDTADGPGWSTVVDVDRVPSIGLPWLAQMVGVVIPEGLSDSDQRVYIKERPNWYRGSVSAVKGAMLPYLTGNKTIFLTERSGSAYHFLIFTRIPETPNTAVVQAAIQAAKPGGLTFTYAAIASWTLLDVYNTFASFQAIYTTYLTNQGLMTNNPGT